MGLRSWFIYPHIQPFAESYRSLYMYEAQFCSLPRDPLWAARCPSISRPWCSWGTHKISSCSLPNEKLLHDQKYLGRNPLTSSGSCVDTYAKPDVLEMPTWWRLPPYFLETVFCSNEIEPYTIHPYQKPHSCMFNNSGFISLHSLHPSASFNPINTDLCCTFKL